MVRTCNTTFNSPLHPVSRVLMHDAMPTIDQSSGAFPPDTTGRIGTRLLGVICIVCLWKGTLTALSFSRHGSSCTWTTPYHTVEWTARTCQPKPQVARPHEDPWVEEGHGGNRPHTARMQIDDGPSIHTTVILIRKWRNVEKKSPTVSFYTATSDPRNILRPYNIRPTLSINITLASPVESNYIQQRIN